MKAELHVHASIIARELKIPCIVGCSNASKLLKDGDLCDWKYYQKI